MDKQNSREYSQRISNWLENWVVAQHPEDALRIEMLAGDGSQRKFFRLSFRTAQGPQSYVVLDDMTWISSKDYAPHQEYLHSRKIAVPRFIAIDESQGIGVLEDLGDELLQFTIKRLEKNRPEMMVWLKRSVALLADLHGNTYPVPATLPVATRFFDEEKYLQEMAFTWEHLVRGYLQRQVPFPEAQMKRFCHKIGALGPPVFCHRDYHTRNILVFKDELFLIDFQDARLGSPVYDLASLIYDAYVQLSDSEKAELETHYRERVSHYPLANAIDWKTFSRDLRWVALQRVVKAAGSFASFYTRFQKKTHLIYLRPALLSAKALIEKSQDELPKIKNLFPVSDWLSLLGKSQP